MKLVEELLIDIFNPDSQDFQTPREDLQLAITLNPDLALIEQAFAKHDKEIMEVIDEMIKKDDWNNKYQFYNNGWTKALTELKQKLIKANPPQ